MLQIKKKFKFIKVLHSFQFLLKNKTWNNKYKLKKTLSKSIILRSPKHFNIGKQKIININYKMDPTSIKLTSCMFFYNFIYNSKLIYYIFLRNSIKNVGFSSKSIKLVVKGKFKIMWLEY